MIKGEFEVKDLIKKNLKNIFIITGKKVELDHETIDLYIDYIQKYYNKNEFSEQDMQDAFDNVALKSKYFPTVAEIVDELKAIKESKPYKMPEEERAYLMSQCGE